jgi:SAM-dependent methyltransferase
MSVKDLPKTDPAGLETLELFEQAPHFNQWLYNEIAPYCRGSILEIGSGIGNISRFFLQQKGQVTLSDLRIEYCNKLRVLFTGRPNLSAVVQLDLSLPDFEQAYPSLLQQFDTVVALNVIEHIENDGLAVSNCRKLLRKNGQLVVLVPAYAGLYNSLDKELGHFRRYSGKRLKNLVEAQGLSVVHTQYFNLAGVGGWWFSGSLLKKNSYLPNNFTFTTN